MEHAASPEPEPQPIQSVTTNELLSIASALTVNASLYAAELESRALHADDLSRAAEFQRVFTELARYQHPHGVVRGYFHDPTDHAGLFEAIQTNLTSWQRKGIVESQREPLEEYVVWLLEAHTPEVLDLFEDDQRRDVERRLKMASIRLGIEA